MLDEDAELSEILAHNGYLNKIFNLYIYNVLFY